jgi:hypothetical protein
VQCNGQLFSLGNQSGGTTLDTNVLGMTCTRSGQGTAGFSYLGEQVYAAPVRIAANTNIGGIIADMPLIPVSKPTPPRSFLPTGTILLFSGPSSAIPTGWHICDGTSGTVDLRNRIPYGATADNQLGQQQGLATHTHTYSGGATTDISIAGYTPGKGLQCCSGSSLQNHEHTYPGGTTQPASSIPPVTIVYFIQKVT